MLELFTSGILGSLFGGLFRLAPEVLKFFDKNNDRKHELSMFTLQTDLEKQRGNFSMEEKYIDHSTAQLSAIQEAFKSQGTSEAASYKWVAALGALVRPSITYFLFGLYVTVKIVGMLYALGHNEAWQSILVYIWSDEDFAMLNMILTFWFVGRAIEKYQK